MLFPSYQAQAVVLGDPCNPESELARIFQRSYAQQSLEHGVLRDVFGIVDAAKHPQTHHKDALVVPARKSRVRVLVSCARSIDQVFIRKFVQ